MRNRHCLACGKNFTYYKYRENTARFCSCKCRATMIMATNSFPKGHTPWNKGLSGWNEKYGAGFKRGEKNPSWNGGVTSKLKDKHSRKWEQWRQSVFKRDNYTCQFCGQKGGRIEPDHIKPVSVFPELAFDLDNGRTLCHPCHKTTPTYARNTAYLRKLYI